MSAAHGRLDRQLQFLIEADKIKSIVRRSKQFHSDRFENDAEHSWHIALMAAVLAEHANEPVDLTRVLTMLLIHDVVEIDAGDTVVYLRSNDTADREAAAARRIFGLLRRIRRSDTYPCGRSLRRENHITYDQVVGVNSRIGEGAESLWKYAKREIDRCFAGPPRQEP
ncbi:MAG: HD domain-containing protein [Spirochaetota bacterium]